MDLYSAPSQEILERVSRHCPEALSTYIQCVNRAGSDLSIYFDKEVVEIGMSEGWTKFKNNIKKLARENLLEWHPFDTGISVTLSGIHEDE